MTDQTRRDPFEVGDRVRVDVPDETHPDHRHHGKNGEIIATIPDTADAATDAATSSVQFRVRLDAGGTVDVQPQFVRPPI